MDETHSTHIGCEVEDPVTASACPGAIIIGAQIQQQELVTKFIQLEELLLFPISCDHMVAKILHFASKVAPDEAAATGNEDFFLVRHSEE